MTQGYPRRCQTRDFLASAMKLKIMSCFIFTLDFIMVIIFQI